MTQQIFRFKAVIARIESGIKYHYVRFPYSVQDIFGTKGKVRMVGTINGVAVDRGLIPDGENGHYIILGMPLMKKAGVRLGGIAHFELHEHQTPNEIEIPEELEAAFEQEPETKLMYDKITPGLRRSVLTYITTAKTPETRAKRTAFLLERFLSGYYLKPRSK